MARYNLVQINNVYLTNDGLSTGDPCRTTVDGLGNLVLTTSGTVTRALDGTPYLQTQRTFGRGAEVTITVETLAKTVYESLVTIVENAALNGTTVSVRISGDLGTFRLNCVPGFPQPIQTDGTFLNQRLSNVRFGFIVQNRANVVTATQAAYNITGRSAVLKRTLGMTASAGAFNLTGNAATFIT